MITQAAKTVFLTAQATSVICARAGESEDFCIKNRPLTREELRRVINGRGNAYRLPMTFDFWRGAMEIDTGKYPGDIHSVFVNAPAPITGHELDPDFNGSISTAFKTAETPRLTPSASLRWRTSTRCSRIFPRRSPLASVRSNTSSIHTHERMAGSS